MDIQAAAAAQLRTQLADGFEERQRLDIADRAADFHQRNICPLGGAQHIRLDGIGNMRDDLHRRAQIIAVAFLADHLGVNAAGGAIIELGGAHPHEAFIVTKIKVGFRAVVGDKHLAVLEGAHRPRIDIDIRVELDQRDAQPA